MLAEWSSTWLNTDYDCLSLWSLEAINRMEHSLRAVVQPLLDALITGIERSFMLAIDFKGYSPQNGQLTHQKRPGFVSVISHTIALVSTIQCHATLCARPAPSAWKCIVQGMYRLIPGSVFRISAQAMKVLNKAVIHRDMSPTKRLHRRYWILHDLSHTRDRVHSHHAFPQKLRNVTVDHLEQ